jgi:hypothetical protein
VGTFTLFVGMVSLSTISGSIWDIRKSTDTTEPVRKTGEKTVKNKIPDLSPRTELAYEWELRKLREIFQGRMYSARCLTLNLKITIKRRESGKKYFSLQ